MITDNGLKVCVEQSKTIQARVFLQKHLFQEYFFVPEDDSEQHELKINLKSWLVCTEGNSVCTDLTARIASQYLATTSPLL